MPDWVVICLAFVPVVALAVTMRSLWTSRAALRISEAQHAERVARARLGLRLDPIARRLNESGGIFVRGTLSRVNFALRIENESDTAAGRSALSVWVPAPCSVRWSDGTGAEVPGSARPFRSSTTLALADGTASEAVEVSTNLDTVSAIGETLYLRVEVPVPHAGRAYWPIRVQLRAANADPDVVELQRVIEYIFEPQ